MPWITHTCRNSLKAVSDPASARYDPNVLSTLRRLWKLAVTQYPNAGNIVHDGTVTDSHFKSVVARRPDLMYLTSTVDGSSLHTAYIIFLNKTGASTASSILGPGLVAFCVFVDNTSDPIFYGSNQ